MRKIIFLADMESFYASVEIARNPSLRGKPVVVCGDPKRRHGIVLAASREAKRYGIKTGMPAWQCKLYFIGIDFGIIKLAVLSNNILFYRIVFQPIVS